MSTPKKKYQAAVTPRTEGKMDAVRRVTREGGDRRAEAFRICRLEHERKLMASGEWTKEAAGDEAWARAIAEYEPLPVEKWTPIEEKYPKEPEFVPPAPPDVAAYLSGLPATTSRNLRAAFFWVGDHPALHREGIGPYDRVYLTGADVEGCPTRMAWNLLHEAVNDRADFFAKLIQKFLKANDAGPAGDATEDEGAADEGLGDLLTALKQAKEAA